MQMVTNEWQTENKKESQTPQRKWNRK